MLPQLLAETPMETAGICRGLSLLRALQSGADNIGTVLLLLPDAWGCSISCWRFAAYGA